ncbi:hypothetical protein BAUCODRAFT_124514 [Baudoinia panamericana UAMH 10762]|uniref:Uncharacterized protein n=1 Tax=Baudoinia panamericana (strain UAMH 10762) TaxID=717646 RepID=M2MQI5_BAUPA|nr:uncharacterized protein BAUCODRAFT_124514 [Baudoinia panamericana UAMH 10762]EMC93753.1 hypothetical protein BAUCODRAFT_124514 [Baudoinia panamericana UAMH 10762]
MTGCERHHDQVDKDESLAAVPCTGVVANTLSPREKQALKELWAKLHQATVNERPHRLSPTPPPTDVSADGAGYERTCNVRITAPSSPYETRVATHPPILRAQSRSAILQPTPPPTPPTPTDSTDGINDEPWTSLPKRPLPGTMVSRDRAASTGYYTKTAPAPSLSCDNSKSSHSRSFSDQVKKAFRGMFTRPPPDPDAFEHIEKRHWTE